MGKFEKKFARRKRRKIGCSKGWRDGEERRVPFCDVHGLARSRKERIAIATNLAGSCRVCPRD